MRLDSALDSFIQPKIEAAYSHQDLHLHLKFYLPTSLSNEAVIRDKYSCNKLINSFFNESADKIYALSP